MNKPPENKEVKAPIRGSSLKFKKPTHIQQQEFDIFLGLEEEKDKSDDSGKSDNEVK